ncbi:MAG: hypothetical protein LBI42_01515 [Chitinispirillales bacterium]|nr:hypothetical protein [Chitinispirillales bacterium]
MPGGFRSANGAFGLIGTDGHWWTAVEYSDANAYCRYMGSGVQNVNKYSSDKGCGLSVLCAQD